MLEWYMYLSGVQLVTDLEETSLAHMAQAQDYIEIRIWKHSKGIREQH